MMFLGSTLAATLIGSAVTMLAVAKKKQNQNKGENDHE